METCSKEACLVTSFSDLWGGEVKLQLREVDICLRRGNILIFESYILLGEKVEGFSTDARAITCFEEFCNYGKEVHLLGP